MPFERNKKRARQILVCGNCHKKKRKCDRNLPCSSCIKLSIDATCAYSTMSYKKQHLQDDRSYSSEAFRKIPGNIDSRERNIKDDSLHNKIGILNNKIKDLEASITMTTFQNKQAPRGSTTQHDDNHIIQKYHANKSPNTLNNVKRLGDDIRLIGINPVLSSEDSINFLDSLTKDPESDLRVVVTPFGPLRFLVLLRQDPASILIWKYLAWPKRKHFSLESVLNENLQDNGLEDLDGRSRIFYGNKYIKRLEKNHSESDTIEVKKAISSFGLTLGLSFTPVLFHYDSNLLEQIKQILPGKRTLHMLINMFFDTLYPFFPILDESAFRADVSRITGDYNPDNLDGHIENIVLGSKYDLAFLATLLITVRLSYLSLFSNDVVKNEELLNSQDAPLNSRDKRYLMQHPIPIEVITVAERCIKEFELITEPSLALFQSLCMMHIYRGYAPEEDPSNNHQSVISIGTLYQMASVLYLNRDPNYILYFSLRKIDERTRMLKRRLWYFLINADIEDSIIYGSPIYTIESNYDTEKPCLYEYTSNISNVVLEREIVTACDEMHPVVMFSHKILDMIFRIRSDMKISDLADHLSDFEILVEKTLGSASEYLVSDNCSPEFLKIQKFKLYLYCKLMLLYMYYCFFLYFENRNVQLSMFYLKKLWAIVHYELAAISGDILCYCDDYFGSAFALMVTPIIEYLTRMRLLLGQFRVRLKNTRLSIDMHTFNKVSMSNSQIKLYINSLDTLTDIVSEIEMQSVKSISSLSKRYFYAWKSSQSYNYGRSILDDDELYNSDKESKSRADLKFSLDELQQLENLLHCCLDLMKRNSSNLMSRTSARNIHPITDSEEHILNKHQFDKFWFLFDLLKQESVSSRNGISTYDRNRENYPINQRSLSVENSNAAAAFDIDNNILYENNLFGSFAMDDFFFDNPFNIIS